MPSYLLMAQLPIADWVEALTDWMTNTFSGLFSFFQVIGQTIMDGITNGLLVIPPLLFIGLITVAAYLFRIENGGYLHFL